MKSKLKFVLTGVSLLFVGMIFSCNQGSGSSSADNAISRSDTTKKVIVVDVRTPGEWNNDGHPDCAVNYPLNEFADHIAELKRYDKVILVCRSGGRAGSALSMLQQAGYEKGENAGAWQNITCQK